MTSHGVCAFLVAILIYSAPNEVPESSVLHRYGAVIVHLAQLIEHYYLQPAYCTGSDFAHLAAKTRDEKKITGAG